MALVASFWVVGIYPFEGEIVKLLAGDGFCNGGEGQQLIVFLSVASHFCFLSFLPLVVSLSKFTNFPLSFLKNGQITFPVCNFFCHLILSVQSLIAKWRSLIIFRPVKTKETLLTGRKILIFHLASLFSFPFSLIH